ncbi:PRC-barrel domain-containing protein [Paenibacillus aurantius]|uniref:PRC-barrel domain-containing protein n=1 Tax=Paenibacillus aurantius TaxID=2918900 RepID=A0AA96LGU9_9BACL|nr:PRC-barrel domain-containing protein [Paenibacillus aurantius]WNQ13020.1 PRC-barrel domain-containing protein [Paenibacillus aurantius]
MRKAKEIIGLPVIDLRSGKQLGTVKDLVMGGDWEAVSLLLETKTWFTAPRCIRWEDAYSIGEDAVTVDGGQAVTECSDSDEAIFLLEGRRKLSGLPVITVNGVQLGLTEDVYFPEELDKRIIGFELTDGFLSDITEGRKWLPLPGKAVMGEDCILVPVQCQLEVKPLTKQE